MASNDEALFLLFSTPLEPLYIPKGTSDNQVVFKVPDNYLDDFGKKIKGKFPVDPKAKSFNIQNITLPEIESHLKLKRKENFSFIVPKHRTIATELIEAFLSQRTEEDLISFAAYCRDKVNPYLFNYALSIALLHRDDIKNIVLPNILASFPGKFIDSMVFGLSRQDSNLPTPTPPPNDVIELLRDFTANAQEPEQRLAYFREDLGVNLHNWHWHLVYPTDSSNRAIVAKDRRGELFYYVHQQILARYNFERFSNGMEYVKPTNLKEALPEGYFPKLELMVSSRPWPPRFRNNPIKDINRPQDELVIGISQVEIWIKNINEAIKNKFALNSSGGTTPLTEATGIDILGNMIQSSMLSPNREFYGNVVNIGLLILAFCHDPDGRYLESFGVLGDPATNLRDPAFYRWQSYINNIFYTYKDSLPCYPPGQLEFNGVSLLDVQINTENKPANEFHTFWEQAEIDVSQGVDYKPKTPVKIRFTYLQHEKFKFIIKVQNKTGKQAVGYIRIFMAPKLNDKGVEMSFNEQRKLMIELDKFRAPLNVGENVITRDELDSSVTIPFERTFRNIDVTKTVDEKQDSSFNFCGCGWPQHMMIPKGNAAGLKVDLFAMVTNYEQDKIVQDLTGICNDAESFCGIQDKKYPDKKSMGFPFDRPSKPNVQKLADFLTNSMKVNEVTIKFTERTVRKNAPPPSTATVVPAAKTS